MWGKRIPQKDDQPKIPAQHVGNYENGSNITKYQAKHSVCQKMRFRFESCQGLELDFLQPIQSITFEKTLANIFILDSIPSSILRFQLLPLPAEFGVRVPQDALVDGGQILSAVSAGPPAAGPGIWVARPGELVLVVEGPHEPGRPLRALEGVVGQEGVHHGVIVQHLP